MPHATGKFNVARCFNRTDRDVGGKPATPLGTSQAMSEFDGMRCISGTDCKIATAPATSSSMSDRAGELSCVSRIAFSCTDRM